MASNDTHDPTWDLSLATVIIYGVLLPPTAFNFYKHAAVGGSPIPGWLFLMSFIILQIVGSAMELANNKYAPILLQVGLSPLLLACLCLLGEANKLYNLGAPLISNTVLNIGYQVFSYVGVAITAVGAVKVLDSPPDPNGQKFEKGGVILLLVALLVLTAANLFILTFVGRRSSAAYILAAVTLSVPLLYVRFVWSLIDIFTTIFPTPSSLHVDFSLPEQGGSIAIYTCLAVLPGMLITIIMDVAGIFSDPDKLLAAGGASATGKNYDSDLSSPQRPNYDVEGRRPQY